MIIKFPIEIAASVEHVWSLLTEPEQQKKWIKGLVANRLVDSDASHIGAKIEFVTRHGKKLTTFEGELTHYAPPQELGLRMWGGNLKHGETVNVHYDLATNLNGMRLTYRCEMKSKQSSILKPIKFVLFQFIGRRMANAEMKKLKSLAEGKK